MKLPRFTALVLLAATVACAEGEYSTLKSILTPAEWARARLDRLSPDELGVIDAALIRHQSGRDKKHHVEMSAIRETAERAQAVATQATIEQKRSWLKRFGLPVFNDTEWRDMPPLQAKVVQWETANRFRLDNGQVWEGVQPITYELVGKNIEIQARPSGQYALVIEGLNTTLRVIRLR